MPNFDVTIQGKTYHVEIPDPGETPLTVIVDGETFQVGMNDAGTGGATTPPVAQAPQPAQLPHPPRVATTRPVAPAGSIGSRSEVVAPMPGTILSVAVKEEDRVQGGQVLCVLEAMKMKNPIRADHAGVVEEVLVQAGQAVAYGDLLVRLNG